MLRNDNKELMELCLLILGESQNDQSVYRFRQAGAYHMARWMAKVIYSFKIYLFRDQFHLNRHRTEFCKSRLCEVTDNLSSHVQLLKMSNVIQL